MSNMPLSGLLSRRQLRLAALVEAAAGLGCPKALLTICFVHLFFCAFRKRGECERWLANAAPEVKRMSVTINGPMLEALAARINYDNDECAEMFRKGILLLGWARACITWAYVVYRR